MIIPVALHSIGQTPRPDLEPFIAAALNTPRVMVTGALDNYPVNRIPAPSADGFPLETRLSDGTRIETDASFLEPLLQANIDRAEDKVGIHVVLCAGPFPNLTSRGVLIRPFEHACDVLSALGASRITVIVPFDGQVVPGQEKWEAVGFRADVTSMTHRPMAVPADTWLIERGTDAHGDAFILDYVGYPRAIVDRVAAALSIPVFDLGYLAAARAREIILQMKGTIND